MRKGLYSLILFISLLLFLGCSRDNAQAAITEQVEPVVVEEVEVSHESMDSALASAIAPVVNLYEKLVYLAFNRVSQAPMPLYRFALSEDQARPGEPVSVGLGTEDGMRRYRALLFDSRDRRIARAVFFDLDSDPIDGGFVYKAAIIAVPSTALVGDALIRIEVDDEVIAELPFTISEREFHAETIDLNPSASALRTTPDPRRTTESQQLWAILNRTGTEVYSSGPFIRPVTSTRRTSIYGSRRLFRYSDGSISEPAVHAGVDYGVPTGTEVVASGKGLAVFARERLITGYTVILEHMPGVYSLYYHLDNIAVEEGEIVEAGQVVGLSGATGLVTGPHLHWEIRVSGENADPDAFLTRPILDKDDLINRIRDEDNS